MSNIWRCTKNEASFCCGQQNKIWLTQLLVVLYCKIEEELATVQSDSTPCRMDNYGLISRHRTTQQEPWLQPYWKKSERTPFYTLPAIHDTSTSTYLAESFAEYLEEKYLSPGLLSNHYLKRKLVLCDTLCFTQAWNTVQ